MAIDYKTAFPSLYKHQGDILELEPMYSDARKYIKESPVDASRTPFFLSLMSYVAEEPIPLNPERFRQWEMAQPPAKQEAMMKKLHKFINDTKTFARFHKTDEIKIPPNLVSELFQYRLLSLNQLKYNPYAQFSHPAALGQYGEILNDFLNFSEHRLGKECVDASLRALREHAGSVVTGSPSPQDLGGQYLSPSSPLQYRILAMVAHMLKAPADFTDRETLRRSLDSPGGKKAVGELLLLLSKGGNEPQLKFLIIAELERIGGYFNIPLLLPVNPLVSIAAPAGGAFVDSSGMTREWVDEVRALYTTLGMKLNDAQRGIGTMFASTVDRALKDEIERANRSLPPGSNPRDDLLMRVTAAIEEKIIALIAQPMVERKERELGRVLTSDEMTEIRTKARRLFLDIPFVTLPGRSGPALETPTFDQAKKDPTSGFRLLLDPMGDLVVSHGTGVAKKIAESIQAAQKSGNFQLARSEETYSYLLGPGLYTGSPVIASAYAHLDSPDGGLIKIKVHIGPEKRVGWNKDPGQFYEVLGLFRGIVNQAVTEIFGGYFPSIKKEHFDNHTAVNFFRDSRSSCGGIEALMFESFQGRGPTMVLYQESHNQFTMASESFLEPVEYVHPRNSRDPYRKRDGSTSRYQRGGGYSPEDIPRILEDWKDLDWDSIPLPPSHSLREQRRGGMSTARRGAAPTRAAVAVPAPVVVENPLPKVELDVSWQAFFAQCDMHSALTGQDVKQVFVKALGLPDGSTLTVEEMKAAYEAALLAINPRKGLLASYKQFCRQIGGRDPKAALSELAEQNPESLGGVLGLKGLITFFQGELERGLNPYTDTHLVYMAMVHADIPIDRLGIPPEGVDVRFLVQAINASPYQAAVQKSMQEVLRLIDLSKDPTEAVPELDFLIITAMKEQGVVLDEVLSSTGFGAGAP